jgi:serine protease Do
MRLTVLSAALCAALPAATAHAAKPAPAVVANATAIAVYVPHAALNANTYVPSLNMWVDPGRAFGGALAEVGKLHFPQLQTVPAENGQPYGLLLDLAPKWSPTPGRLTLEVKFDVYDAAGTKLHSGKVEQRSGIKAGDFNATADHVAKLAVQQVMTNARAAVKPDPARFPATASSGDIDLSKLVDRDKPLRTGTAFFINASGQLLTATHLARDCAVMEAHQDGVTFPVTARASSDLLDVTVLDSGRARSSALALRKGFGLELGEPVTSVGFPLKGLLGDSVNVTRGNASGSKGLRGSLGMFQFSAPIQPGNSGGPVVSDHGELLGMAVGTLNAERLAKHGLVPQNVNFALDARHLAKFLQREGVAFDVAETVGAGGLSKANQAALSNTVQFTCYQ